jgi:ketosteroid isomerase-like protein
MKIRLLGALVGLAISFALPCIAQDKNTVDPQIRQDIEALLVKGDEAYNKRDAAALAARYTEDAVFVGGIAPGPHYRRQNIEQRRALDMEEFRGELSHELLQVYQLGIDVCAVSKLSIGQWKGYGVFIFVREADAWKIRSEYDSTLIE